MRPCRAFTVAACLLPLGLSALASGAALAQWPAPQGQQQAPASAPSGAWPAPQQQSAPAAAPQGAWPAPQQGQPPAAAPATAPAGAWPAPQAPQAAAPQPGFMPPGGGFGPAMAGPQQQQEPPCFKEFMALRTETDKRGMAIQAAGKKKVQPAVACRLFNDFSAAEVKLIKFVTSNAEKCQMPKELIDNLSKGHAKTTEIRTRVCEAAAAGPPKPAAPTLSDVLSSPVPDSSNVRKGRGTFDTLSGSPLAR